VFFPSTWGRSGVLRLPRPPFLFGFEREEWHLFDFLLGLILAFLTLVGISSSAWAVCRAAAWLCETLARFVRS
jgi:hypothetical protein